MIRLAEKKDIADIAETYTELLQHEEENGSNSNRKLNVYPTIDVPKSKIPTGTMYALEEAGEICASILYALMGFEVVRFNELKKYIKTISYKTLSSTLKELEADGLVHREEYPQIPPKVEYSLTEREKSLIPILDQLCEWGETHRLP